MKHLFYLSVCLAMLLLVNQSIAQDAVINILHVNDTHSNLTPGGSRDENLRGTIGGIARATSVIGAAMDQDDETLLLHAGDMFMGDLWFYLTYGMAELQWMKTMEFDAMTIGNHEFDLGTENLIGVMMESLPENEIPLLSGNLTANTEFGEILKVFTQPNTTLEVHGIKVGIFGMTSPDANTTSLAGPDITVAGGDPMEMMQLVAAQVEELRTAGCQVVIFLSHLGFKYDSLVADNIPGIEVIIGGHDHFAFEEAVTINNTRIVQAGAFYEHIGSIQLNIKDGKLEDFKYSLIKLDENIPEYPDVKAELEQFIESREAEIKALFTQQIAEVGNTLSEFVPEVKTIGDKTTDVGCLITDAFREFGQTDIGFTTCGLSAQPLYKGAIVSQDVVKMLGYGINEQTGIGYNMATFSITGEGLMAGMQYCMLAVEGYGNDEFLPQLSGMSFKYDPLVEGYPITSVLVKGEPIDIQKTYTITSSIFVAMLLQSLEIPISDFKEYPEFSDFMVLADYIIKKQYLEPGYRERVTTGIEDIIDFQYRNIQSVKFFPNPVQSSAQAEVTIEKPGYYTVAAYDIIGMKSFDLGTILLNQGTNHISLDFSSLNSGKYFMKISNKSENIVSPVIIQR